MKLIILVNFLIISAEDATNWEDKQQEEKKTVRNISPRIINGVQANPLEFPFAGALFVRYENGTGNGRLFCGCSLISTNHALTAAHCVDNAINATLVFGAYNVSEMEPNQQRFIVFKSEISVHKNWNPTTLRNDIAVIKLSGRAVLNSYVKTIKLPSFSQASKSFENLTATVQGWGKTKDSDTKKTDMLRWVNSTIISNDQCQRALDFSIVRSQICLDGSQLRGPCQGDSGGALTTIDGRLIQIGIVSFGTAEGCEKGFPTVYTRITSFIHWIRAHTRKN